MSCGITYDKNGKIVEVLNEQGKPSKLYKDALKATGSEQQAKRLFLLTKTPMFKEDVIDVDNKRRAIQIKKQILGEKGAQNLDRVEEYSLKQVYDYYQAKNYEGETLNEFEVEEAKDVMLVNNIENSNKLFDKLTKAFIVDGVFNPTISSLKTFYSDLEVKRAFESLGSLKSFYYRFKNTKPFVNNQIESDKRFLYRRSFETNSLGKFPYYNPLIEQEKFRLEFGGIKEETRFEDKSLFEQYSKLKRVKVVDKNNQEVPQNKIKEFLEITLKDDSDGSFRRMIRTLLNAPTELWNDADVKKLKQKIHQTAIKHSLDLKSFEDLNEKDSRRLMTALVDAFETSELDGFADIYDEIFAVNKKPREFVTSDTRPVVKLYDKTNDYNLFKQFGYLPLGDRVYLKTDALEKSLQEVKDILGEPDAKLVKSINLEGAENVDIETMQKMALYSKRFKTLLEDNTKQDIKVKGEFFSDLYREYLKNPNSPKYENFIFTEKGLDYYINKKDNVDYSKPPIYTGNYFKVSETEIQADEIHPEIRTQDGRIYYPTSNNVYSINKEDYLNKYEPLVNNQPIVIRKGKNDLDCK